MSSINIYIILSILSLFQTALSFPAPTRVSITHDVVSHVPNGSFPTTSLPILHGAEHVNLPSVEIDDKSTEHEDDGIRAMILPNATITEHKRDEPPTDKPADDPSAQDWRDRMVEFTWSHEGMDLDVWFNKIRHFGSVKINIPPQYHKEKRGTIGRGFRIRMDSWNDWRPRGELYFWIEGGHEFWVGGDFKWDEKQIIGEEMKIYEW
ncbi:hypothetical protein DTO027B5_6923 [Paecilomyces variotii]|nr:hypothetical protein DTO027B3_7344 [Paecilomyces variotii]KAJ9331363.1 hypothetical protein DTO027B5_6923 [Paecilomyces variotii]KAJ9395536.1 hypothetical protein DTO282F9_7493 [Paecilomyces variotii]